MILSMFVTVNVAEASGTNLYAAWGDFETVQTLTPLEEGSEIIRYLKDSSDNTLMDAYWNTHSYIVGYAADPDNSSNQCLELYQNGTNGTYPVLFNAPNLQPGGVYKFSVKIKGSENIPSGAKANVSNIARKKSNITWTNVYELVGAGNGTVTSLKKRYNPSSLSHSTSPAVTVSQDWQTLTNYFYIPSSLTESLSPYFTILSKAGTIYIDDVSLEKIGEISALVSGAASIEIPKEDEEATTSQYTVKTTFAGMDYAGTDIVPQLSLKETYTGVSFDASTGTITVDNTAHIGEIVLQAQIPAVADVSSVEIVDYPIQLTYDQGTLNPQIRDLSLVGTVLEGETLTATFTYYDPANKAPHATGGATAEWYGRNDSTDSWSLMGAATDAQLVSGNDYQATYTFASAPAYTEVMCRIALKNEDGLTATADSDAIKGPVPPEIKGDITFSGDATEGNAFLNVPIEAEYGWFDGNGDARGTDIIQWYRLDSETDTDPEEITGATSATYTPTNDDLGKFLQVSVIPVSAETPNYVAENIKFSPVVMGPRKPVAENPEVVLKSGYTYQAKFNYTHEQGVDRGATIIEWYLNDELVATVTDSDEYTFPQYTVGELYAKITPVAQVAPNGDTVTTDPISIDTSEPLNIFDSWGGFETPGTSITYGTGEYADRITNIDGVVRISTSNAKNSWIVGYADEAYAGSKSLEIRHDQAEGYYPIVFRADNLDTGAVYKISAQIKLKEEAEGTGRTGNTNWRTTTSGVYYIDKRENGTIKALANRSGDYTTPTTGGLTATPVSSTDWTLVEAEFFVPASESETMTVNFGLSGKIMGYYVDNVKLQKMDELHFEVNGANSIEIPKQGQENVTAQYSASLVAAGKEFLTALEIEPTFGLKENYTGVSIEGNTLTIDDTAVAGEIVLVPQTAEVSKNGAFSEEYPIQLTYTGALNPQVRNLIVTGNVKGDTPLTAEYTYYDPTGSAKNIELITWEGKNPEDESWTFIPGATLSLATGASFPYSLVRCIVTVTNANGLSSSSAESNVAQEQTAPEARNITFSGMSVPGNALIGETIVADYEWYDVNDLNGVNKGTDTYQWYRLDSAVATPVAITGATTRSYAPTLDDVGKYLQLGITAKSLEAPEDNGETPSGLIQGPLKPTAQNVSITKTNNNILTVNYDYVHPQNVPEGVTTFQWYMGGRPVSTAAQYTVPANTQANVYVVVTPVAQSEPVTGDAVTSATISVNTTGGGNGGGNGGGGGGAGSMASGAFGNAGLPSQSGTIIGSDDVTVTETPVSGSVSAFADVQNHWAKDCIEELVDAGILKGVDEDSFAPDSKVNRAEFCTMIYRALGLAAPAGGQKFGDVSADKWYYESVQAVAEKGIINGDGQNFNPENEMSRQEMAKVIWAAISDKVPTPSAQVASYGDAAQVNDWAKDAINSLSFYKILEGSEGNFRPLASMTRAEAAAVISRVMRLINGGK